MWTHGVTFSVCQSSRFVGSKSIPVRLLVAQCDWSASHYTLASDWSAQCAGLACLDTRHLMKLVTAWSGVGVWMETRTVSSYISTIQFSKY